MELDLTNDQRATLESGKAMSGEIRLIARQVGKNHALGLKLWELQSTSYRLLALLIMDTARVPEVLDTLVADIENMDGASHEKLSDWLLANQVMHLKNRDAIVAGWLDHPSVIRQSMFWAFHARIIRKAKKITHEQAGLLDVIETRIQKAESQVQWTMNYCAAQIGIFDLELRPRCIGLGENTGLYKNYKVTKGCTSPYLPAWIQSEVYKNGKRT